MGVGQSTLTFEAVGRCQQGASFQLVTRVMNFVDYKLEKLGLTLRFALKGDVCFVRMFMYFLSMIRLALLKGLWNASRVHFFGSFSSKSKEAISDQFWSKPHLQHFADRAVREPACPLYGELTHFQGHKGFVPRHLCRLLRNFEEGGLRNRRRRTLSPALFFKQSMEVFSVSSNGCHPCSRRHGVALRKSTWTEPFRRVCTSP